MNPTLIAIATVACSQIALAQAPDKSLGRQRFADGKVKYAVGDYRRAAELFTAAYKADPDPAYIFNVGQAYRRSAETKSARTARDCQQAMVAYKKFLAQMPAAPNKTEVDEYIEETTACAGPLATEPNPVPNKPVDRPVDKPVDKPIPRPLEQPATSAMQWSGIGVGVVGVLALGVGVYYTKLGHDTSTKHDELVNQVNSGELGGAARADAVAEIQSLDNRGLDHNKRAYAGWLIGGGLVIGGALLYVLGEAKPKEHALVVAPSKDGAMVVGSFRF